jgi:hypothetical protein
MVRQGDMYSQRICLNLESTYPARTNQQTPRTTEQELSAFIFTKLTKRTTLGNRSFDKGIEGSEAKTDINEVAEGAGGIDKLSKTTLWSP